MSKIKNIIYDLGGVLLQIDYSKTRAAFIALGITNFDDFYKQDFVSVVFENFEIGAISSNQFYDEFRKITNTHLTNEEIENAWNAMLGSFWIDRIDWLNTIKTDYNIFLFSNTNQIHYDAFVKIYKKNGFQQPFSNYFIKDYYSHILGDRKPNKKAYQNLILEQKLIPSETLFIDDTLKNIEGAAAAGLQTLYLKNGMDLITSFKKCCI